MNVSSAYEIGKKAKAYKHCVRLIKEIDEQGEKMVKLNCTGVNFKVKKGDSIYLRFVTTMSQLREELAEYELFTRKKNNIPVVAPAGSAPEDILAAKREKKKAYYREYYQKRKALKQNTNK